MDIVLDKKKIRIVLWILLAGMLITFFLPYLSIQWEDYDVLGIANFVEVDDSSISPLDCLLGLCDMLFDADFDEVKSWFTDDDIENIYYRFSVSITIAYIILLINIFLFIKKNWNKICFTILHSISFLCIQSYYFMLYHFEQEIKKSVDEEIGIFKDLFGSIANSAVSEGVKILKDALSSGYWIFTICSILVFIVLILDTNRVRLFFGLKAGNSATSISENDSIAPLAMSNPRLQVLSGKYSGAKIKLQNNERIIIGRNPKCCHLILEAPEVSGEHCEIRYEHAKNVFCILDKSLNGTYKASPDGNTTIRLQKGTEEYLSAGTIITIGKEGDRIQLLD